MAAQQGLDAAWHALGLQVARRGHRDLAQHRQPARRQIAVGQRPHPQRRIHAFAQQIDIAVAFADLQFDLRVALQELRQVGKQQVPAQRAMHLNAQGAARRRVTEGGLGVVHVGDQA